MITDKDIENSRTTIKQLIQEGLILPANQEYVDFFFKKAKEAMETAEVILKISSESRLKKDLNLLPAYQGNMWVIYAAYYAMFYAATALLAKYNHRIKNDQNVHALTYHALIHYFLDNDKKLPKHILEEYKQAEEDASQL